MIAATCAVAPIVQVAGMLIAATGIYRESQHIATHLEVGWPRGGCDLPRMVLRSAKFCQQLGRYSRVSFSSVTRSTSE
jgi:hypothetical protein